MCSITSVNTLQASRAVTFSLSKGISCKITLSQHPLLLVPEHKPHAGPLEATLADAYTSSSTSHAPKAGGGDTGAEKCSEICSIIH